MATDELTDLRSTLVQDLLTRIGQEPYPSVTQLNMVESMLAPDEVPEYVQVLLQRVKGDLYPSLDMQKRIMRFV
ncbi:hypothetical protein [Nesterenkonia pannonica]|uniref:hypothetical protein n=1 Tax=Nesterenkonia pannonica TaxID=1548602 RepID=UPI002164A1A5|nr:hypothetical protein [Nesterenkonia pannonica]